MNHRQEKPARRESVIRRVLISSSLLLGCFALVLTGAFLASQRSAFLQQLRARADTLATFLAAQAQYPILVGDRQELERAAANASAGEDVLLVCFNDATGHVLATSDQARRAGAGTAAATSDYIETSLPVPAPRRDALVEWQGRHGSQPPLGTVRIRLSTKKAETLFVQVVLKLIGIIVAALALILIVQYVDLRRSLRPLETLIRFTKRVGSGDLTRQAPVERLDEIGELAVAFNQMVVKLGETTVSRDYMDNVLRSMGEALIVTDARLAIRRVNRAAVELLGYREEDLLGRPVSLVLGRAGELENQIHSAGAQAGRASAEGWMRRADGSRVPVSLSAAMLLGPGREVQGMVCLAQDITERRRAQEALIVAKEAAEEASRAKSSFLANMSHELRTPLNAIIGYSEMLVEEAEETGRPELVPDLQKICAAGKHLLTLINDVLDISKIEAGRMELHMDVFPVGQLIADAVSNVEPIARANGNRLAVKCADPETRVRADAVKFRQVLVNLLGNACKFTEHGTVTLEVAESDAQGSRWIHWHVRDTGIGIPPEQLGKLFRSFTQVDSSTTRKHGGTGLGLAISQRLCQMMGGWITVESAPEKGSTFTIHMPTDRSADERGRELELAGSAEAALAATVPSDQGTVLLIDDDPDTRDLLERALSREGFCVATAPDGETGLRMARESRPSAIVLDILLPGTDGWSVLRQLKADSLLAPVPVIVHTVTDNRSLGRELGAEEFLQKPSETGSLAAALRKHRRPVLPRSAMVVEDDPLARQAITRLLRRQFPEVIEAANGREALERLKEQTPGLIVLDLMMPEMDGFQFVAELSRTAEWQGIPVVVLTAKDVTIDELEQLSGPVRGVLQKGQAAGKELLEAVCAAAVRPAMAGAVQG